MKLQPLILTFALITFLCSCGKNDDDGPKSRWELQRGTVNNFRIVDNNLTGYIDSKGKVVIAPQFNDGEDFYFNHATITENNLDGLIDEKGTKVIPASFNYLGNLNSNGILVTRDATSKCGLINTKGQVVLTPQAGMISDIFSENLIYAELNNNKGYMDSKGKFVIKIADADYGEPFNEGYAMVKNSSGLLAIFDKTGKNKTGYIYKSSWFSSGVITSGVAAVLFNDTWGFVRPDGAVVIPAQYEKAFPFFEGLAVVEKNNKFGCIDMSGKEIVPITYEGLGYYFSEGLLSAYQSGKWGYIDKNNKFIIAATLLSAQPFINGVAKVTFSDGKPGYIDKKGVKIWSGSIPNKKSGSQPSVKELIQNRLFR
jgi:hypothetical protein